MSELNARVAFCVRTSQEFGSALYIWGGDSEGEGGFDCSGFASRRLMWADHIWPGIYSGGRTTADGLYRHYDSREVPDITEVDALTPGCLLFYRSSAQSLFYHVAIHLCTVPPIKLDSGELAPIGPVAIESAGGGSRTLTPRDALLANAGVQPTASDNHGRGLWVAKDPFSLLSF